MVTNNSKALKSIASGIADMEPEAGWHPSHPEKKLPRFLNFFAKVSILCLSTF